MVRAMARVLSFKLYAIELFILTLLLNASLFLTTSDDFYDILGVSRHATDTEIRKGFKKRALELHPDKNKDDDEAQAKFIKLNKAYEVLKDENLRKKYDLNGEDGIENSRSHANNYHSWNYYHDNFGIYDDDLEIITLNRADFEQSVSSSSDVWFINFYHPMCSHCHTIAPIWRQLAQDLDGVIRIGAVNCDDEFQLCSSQGVRSYPKLIAYPNKLQFAGEKNKENLINFILGTVQSSKLFQFYENNWKTVIKACDKSSWLLIAQSEYEEKEDFELLKKKLGAIFDGLLCFGEISCQSTGEPCLTFGVDKSSKFFKNVDDLIHGKGNIILTRNPQELAKEVLNFLPDIPILASNEYEELKKQLKDMSNPIPRLIVFTDENDEKNLEIRKLPPLLPSFLLSQIRCNEMKKECDDLFILKTPAFVLFKMGGGYEIHQGRVQAKDIAVFAREGALATHFQILTPKEFPEVLNDGSPWFVDFYAPWCPPCMKLLPEFRKASRMVSIPVKFGSIDCTTHSGLCNQFNIRQYPTTILYNSSAPHHYNGKHSASHLADFVQDTIHPTVIILNDQNYEEMVSNKKANELWVVDFYANWCSHCIEMAPEYRRFARLVSGLQEVHIAQIDCAVYRHICQTEGVNGYPTIKLFPQGSTGTSISLKYNGWNRDAESFRQWLYTTLPSEVESLNDRTFEEMLRSKDPWIVEFFAPWCPHCHAFAPTFEEIAAVLKNQVRCGKVNCETYHWLCQGAEVRAYPTLHFYEGISGDISRQSSRGRDIVSMNKDDILLFVQNSLNIPIEENLKNHDEL